MRAAGRGGPASQEAVEPDALQRPPGADGGPVADLLLAALHMLKVPAARRSATVSRRRFSRDDNEAGGRARPLLFVHIACTSVRDTSADRAAARMRAPPPRWVRPGRDRGAVRAAQAMSSAPIQVGARRGRCAA